jgi:hypothetical protein
MVGRCSRKHTGHFGELSTPVTYKENFEWIILQAGTGDADVYHRWDHRSVLVPGSGCFRWLQISDTVPSLNS